MVFGECPGGTIRTGTLFADGFESGTLPETKDSNGWVATADGDPAHGRYYATSTLQAGAPKPFHALFLPVVKNSSGRTVLRFAVRGTYGSETAFVAVNEAGGWMEGSKDWGVVALDVTASAGRSPGEFDIRILNYPENAPSTPVTIDVDNLEVYRCSPVPATGVRGDFTGDRRADVPAVDRAGNLWLFPGRADGTLGAGLLAGRGWGSATWLGSPGDLTGDRRSDLLVRRADGSLVRYDGRGGAGFSGPVQIGRGWQGMTALVLPGDTDGDRRPELLARDSAGTIWRYSFLTANRLSAPVAIGRRFGAIRHITSTGDMSGDGLGDVLAVRPDGRMVRYQTNRRGGLRGVALMGYGWNAFVQLLGPGDINGDGRGDLIGRKPDGSLVTYFGGVGRLTGGKVAANGWQAAKLIG